jgi:hypothetical protein
MLVPQVALSPSFHVDEAYFKTAGYHWIADGHWAAPEAQGFKPWAYWEERRPKSVEALRRLPNHSPDMDEVFATYPPGYPALYAGWTKLLGFGWRQAVLFDGFINLLLALLVWHLCGFQLGRTGVLPLIAGMIILIQGHSGRPDEAGMLAGLGSLWVLVTRHSRSPICASLGAGLLLGLCASISQPCALVAALAATGRLTTALSTRRYRALIDLCLMACVSIIIFGSSWALLIAYHADAFKQYQIATKLIIDRPMIEGIKSWAEYYNVRQWLHAPIFILSAGLAAWFRPGMIKWISAWGGPLLGFCLLFRTSAWQMNYVWFITPYLLMNLASHWDSVRSAERIAVRIQAAALSLIAMVVLANFVSRQCHALTATEAISLRAFERYLATQIPDGSVVAVDDALAWYLLAPRCRVWIGFGTPSPTQATEVTHIVANRRLRVTNQTQDWEMVPLWARPDLAAGRFKLMHQPEKISDFPVRNFAVFAATKP